MPLRATTTAPPPATGPDSRGTAADPAAAPEPPAFQLSLRQLLTGAAAAVTAAVLGSRLGVAGTLIGAGLASTISMIAAAVYSHSLAAAAYRVKVARTYQEAVPGVSPESTGTLGQAWSELPTAVIAPVMTTPAGSPSPQRRRSGWLTAGLGVVAACTLALLAVTGIEAVRGTPLSGGAAGGLSVLGGAGAGTADTTSTTPLDSPSEVAPVSTSSSVVDTGSDGTDPATTSTTVTSTVTVTPVDPTTSVTAPSGTEGSVDAGGAAATSPTTPGQATGTATTGTRDNSDHSDHAGHPDGAAGERAGDHHRAVTIGHGGTGGTGGTSGTARAPAHCEHVESAVRWAPDVVR